MRAEAHFVVVHSEMHHAAAELEEFLTRVAVVLVLLDGVFHRLLGQAVLQLEGSDGQAVDEQAEIERQLRLVAAVAQLAGDAEAVGGVERLSLGVAQRRCAEEEVDVVRTVFDAVAQHIDRTALADLALQASQEFAPRWPVRVEVQRLCCAGLCLLQKCGKLRQVHAVLAVVVAPVAQSPARTAVERAGFTNAAGYWRSYRVAGHGCDNEAFEAPFARVGGGHTGLRELHVVSRVASLSQVASHECQSEMSQLVTTLSASNVP